MTTSHDMPATGAAPAVRVTRAGPLATVTLARPAVRNAFDDATIAALTAAFDTLGREEGVRAIVLAAEGPAFCAGADLHWMRRMAGYSRDENTADAQKLADMLRTLHACPRPTIARVHGDVYAGGMGLVAACDVAIAAEGAAFCLSEVRIGLVPATIGPYVVRAMGPRAAQRYCLSGERFDAAEALRIGFVHEVVAPQALDARVAAIAAAFGAASPAAVRATKALVHTLAAREIDDALVAHTVRAIADIRASDEGREGVQAFLQKRAPAWRDAAP